MKRLNTKTTKPLKNSRITKRTERNLYTNLLTISLLVSLLSIPKVQAQYWNTNLNHIFNINSGNVGIGTTDPAAKLHLSGGNLLLDNGQFLTVTRSDDGFAQQLFGMDGNNDILLNRSAIVHGKVSRTIIGFNGRSFDVRNGSNQTLLRIIPNGNIGIGTINPLEKIDINGALRIGTTTSTNSGTIRWTGGDFEGYNGSNWVSLTSGTGGGTDNQNISGSGLSGTMLTIGIERGNSETVDLASLQDGTGTDELVKVGPSGTPRHMNTTDFSDNGTDIEIADNAINATKLNVTGNGTSGQVLQSNGDGSFAWANAGGNSLWIQSGDDIIFNNGNVGIGTTPATNNKLEVSGNVHISASLSTWTSTASSNSISLGNGNSATFQSIAMGLDNTSTGHVSVTIGEDNTITSQGSNSIAIGGDNMITASQAYALGKLNESEGLYALATGTSNTATGVSSVTLGGSNQYAVGDYSATMGYRTIAEAYATVAIGRYNSYTTGDETTWVSSDPLFIAGNGSALGVRSAAFVLFKNGNATLGGTLSQNSDLRLKDDVITLSDALTKIKKLRGVSFKWKDDAIHDTKEHIGLIAQEVEKVYPELVVTGDNGMKSVDYSSIVAPLIEAVKELDVQNKAMSAKIEAVEAQLAATNPALTTTVQSSATTQDEALAHQLKGAVLYQNTPNPFNQSTVIRYALPEGTQQAGIIIYNMNGVQLMAYDNLQGKDQLEINAHTLKAGMYLYSLIADGQEVDTKRMILTR